MWPFSDPIRKARREAEIARLERMMAENQRRLDELKQQRETCPVCDRRSPVHA